MADLRVRFPNPAVRLPQWRWLQRFDRWRCEHGILTGRWTQAEIDGQTQRAKERASRLLDAVEKDGERDCG